MLSQLGFLFNERVVGRKLYQKSKGIMMVVVVVVMMIECGSCRCGRVKAGCAWQGACGKFPGSLYGPEMGIWMLVLLFIENLHGLLISSLQKRSQIAVT
jgi:hypothetical protein